MILFSHPTGNANVRHAALGLQSAGLLGEFWTCINSRPESALNRLLPGSIARQLNRRSFPAALQPHLYAYPFFELSRLLAPRLKLGHLTRHEKGCLSVDAVYHSLDRRVSRRLRERPHAFSGVYAYEDGAAFTFREARQRGLKCFYDQPIGYWRAARALLLEEAERQPGWASTLIGNEDSEAKTARKDEELALADLVFVASSYTLQTLANAPQLRAPVVVIPYGAPPRPAQGPTRVARPTGTTLRAIFVGSLGQRKGLSYLFEACRSLGKGVELTVIGTPPLQPCPALDKELQQIRWIPSCPHAQVLEEMARHDVFVFPSLFEGFGLVLLEAMAMGLPVITTAHTAGPDLMDDGVEGFIVPIRSSQAIAEKLDLLRREPGRVEAMGHRAAARAVTFTWDSYGQRLAGRVAEACQGAAPTGLVRA